MRKIFLSAAAFTTLTGAAFAADLPSTKAVPPFVPPPPAFSWTGFYLGVYGGGTFGNSTVTATGFGHYSQSLGGGTAGGLGGYNYMVNQNFVLGVEGEFGYQGNRGAGNFVSFSNGFPLSQTVNADYIGRIRGRLGLALNNALFYIAGGGSFSDEKIALNQPTIPNGPASISKGIAGWNIGAGVDYAFMPNLVARLEYIYDGYGSTSYNFANTAVPVGPGFVNRSASVSDSTVRAALIYKFGAPESVVAKY